MGARGQERTVVRVVGVEGKPTKRALTALAGFGIAAGEARGRYRADDALVRRAVDALRDPGAFVLVTGASGSGKSTLLRAVAERLRRRGRGVAVVGTAARLRYETRTVIDAMPGGVGRALGCLAGAGLSDALLLARRVRDLSEGELARFAVARALAGVGRGDRPAVLVIDELGSVLDRATARGLCVSLRRAAARAGVCVLGATAHADVIDWIDASCAIDAGGEVTL